MACSSGGISRSSKIFVIFVPVGPRAAGPGITAGAGLTSTAFSGGFGGTSGFLPSASIFSVGAAVFGVSSGFFFSGVGVGFISAGFSSGFGDISGFYRLHPHFPETEPLSAFLPVSSPPALAQVLHQRPCLAISVA